ncbi:MAG: CHAT domain-containing tetratricopeptide repeat protein [Mariprofundus sp.]|nr:CHAT domain-containing tetratricopeptide repeat protein [Mariprofundus sp.]
MSRLYLPLILVVLFFCGCAMKVPMPTTKIIDDHSLAQSKLNVYNHNIPYQSVSNKSVSMPKEGEVNAYGIIVTPELALAYGAYLGGDGEEALAALKKAGESSSDDTFLWLVSFLKVKIYMMMGLSADALQEVNKAVELEVAYSGSNLNSYSLRGEVKVWLEDFDGAEKDFFKVLTAIGDWELPTSYMGPPTNMSELFSTTTAQLRSYTGLAALYQLQGKYHEALRWSEQAEKRYNAIYYVVNHPVYGFYMHYHLDVYYGRAMNLTFLASSLTALSVDSPRAQMAYDEALHFFDVIQYAKGKATVLAFRALAYKQSGQLVKADKTSLQALDVSIKSGMLDFVWRIETLRGQVLLRLGRMQAAEQSYRRAFKTLNYLSSSLQSDISKRTFGIGKNDITLQLVQFDMQKNDLPTLFSDLEISRARAFVDILANRSLDQVGNAKLKKIKALDHLIMKQRLLNSARGSTSRPGARIVAKQLKHREALVEKIHKSNPELASVVSIWTTTLGEMQKQLNVGEAMIYFLPVRAGKSMQFLYITRDDVAVHSLKVTENALHHQLKQLRSALGYGDERAGGKRGIQIIDKSTVSDSHKATLATIVGRLKRTMHFATDTIDKLYVVPYASLNFLPWALLGKDYAVSILPNGSWLNIHKTPNHYQGAVIVGDPNFAGELPQLEGARAEAKALAALYQTSALIGADATPENVRKKIGQGVATLHLATHAVFYKDAPLNSALFLTKNQHAYALTAEKLYQKPLRAELVVLSACETGMGESQGDNDFLGLTRSFYLGGSKAVLNTLWPVDDEGAKLFMLEFHRYAIDGEYAKGWLAAKELLKAQGYSPAVYGAFVLNGVDRE